MPNRLNSCFAPWILRCALLLGTALPATDALAQTPDDAYAQMSQDAPPQQGGPSNPICIRLEGQLATIDRGGGDSIRDDQIRRYQEAASRQQAELDRVIAQGRRMGCDGSGFFSLFNNGPAQCGPINTQIQQMRGNLDQIMMTLERMRSGGLGGADRENQRRSVLTALAQNNCGPQYANAGRGPGNFLDNLFGNRNDDNVTIAPPAGDLAPQSGTYRTVCVRSCDGAYFPISFATVQGRFADDEKTCKAQCPAAEATLFAYRNPGEDINQAVSVNGQPYTSLPNAFKFRTEFNPSCSCKPAGQTWAEALKSVDDKATVEQQGDIIVTEESARKMQQRAQQQSTKQAPAGKKGATSANATPAPDAPAAPVDQTPPGDRPIRTVGPTFLPKKQQ
ncbi:DUF2865 domain-containing protein [Bradyrhizobium sp. Arg237L]|uniref:DUF2865 domain-containing protein n=1 Tax=Bradyrhizobium sp. Arg237L TaxID=3003352 RepID=UPI00249DFFF8|nr:DUF2865 domain-containing protein [Bradyrhizobium sp. Arg237L]MDI4236368.1 DUF2865 domain-containing protein [Bradyrhizobium sp. Arg237L]